MAAHQAPLSLSSPGKNTGVGCHFLLQCIKVKSESEVAQSCPSLKRPMDCSLPGSSDFQGKSTGVGCHCLLSLPAIYCPKEVAVLHCKGHSRDGSKATEDNQLADCQARKAGTLWNPFTVDAFDLDRSCGTGKTTIYWGRIRKIWEKTAKITDKGWLKSEDGRLIIPENAQWKILKGLHQSFHLGAESTYQMASHLFEGKNQKVWGPSET